MIMILGLVRQPIHRYFDRGSRYVHCTGTLPDNIQKFLQAATGVPESSLPFS